MLYRLTIFIALLLGFSFNSSAQTIYSRSGLSISTFDAASPGTIINNGLITGVTGTQTVVGMDFRPLNGQLYIMGYESLTGTSQLYTVDPSTFVATSVGSSFTIATNQSLFGFDFNPTVDRIRVTTSQGKNYRIHPITGAIAATDLDLQYAPTDVNAAATPFIVTGAYTNSYIGSTSTTLYTYDDNLNILCTQVPPNNGTQNTIGASGIMDAGPAGSLDIYYNAMSATNTAYFKQDVNMTGIVSQLFTMNLTTGNATLVGTIGSAAPVADLAVQITVNTPPTVSGQLIYGLTSNGYLISFDAGMPSVVRSHQSISGVAVGQVLVGLDSRPATGQLYAMGYNSVNGESQLYIINPSLGTATSVAAPIMLATGMANIGFDFNPTVDRIRVTSALDNNYRLHPETGAIVATDGNLVYAGTDVNSAANPNIGAGAYSNSYIGGTSTQLFNYDVALNVLTLQNPPNNGTLNTLGSSGITVNAADPSIDFDFYYNTVMGMNENYAIANTANTFDNLYMVNTATGVFTSVGMIGNGIAVIDMAVEIVPNIPSMVAGETVYGITSNQYLITFDSEAPEVVRTHVAISGITAGQVIAGLDVRPATGELYALGYNSMNGEAQLYTINPTSGATASVAMPVTLATGMSNIGFDFNPTVDRIRVVSSTGNNYRLHPTTGAIAATDMNLAFAATDPNSAQTPAIGSAAYTNSFGGSNNTKLFVYDDALNILALQNPPNNGTLNTIGSSMLMQNGTDVTSDLDIFYNHDDHTNHAFLISNSMAFDMFYSLNTSTGAVTSVGSIGNGIAVRDIAIKNDSITVISSSASTIMPMACGSYLAPDNMEYTTSGMYTAIIPNELGYDSLITINLTVNNVDNSITVMNDTVLMAMENGGTYQWINCSDNTIIANETSQTFAPIANGTYAAIITSAEGCTDTSACAIISILSAPEFNAIDFTVSPNPSNGIFNISVAGINDAEIVVIDMTGRQVFKERMNGSQTVIDLTKVNNGVYLVKVGNEVKQIAKQ